jgi:CBS domain-containing protein
MSTVEEILMIKGPDVIVASSDTTVRQAAMLISQANVGSIIVKDGEETKGIFTERDVLQRVVAKRKDPDTTLLGDVMSSPIKSCRLNDEVSEVAGLLTCEHIRHLAIIEDGALIGLIGLRDVMAAKIREQEEQIAILRKRLGEDA